MLPLEDEGGDILRKAMRGKRFTQESLAEATGISAQNIASWASASSCLATPEQAHSLARILGLDPGKFADAVAANWQPHAMPHPNIHTHVQKPHPSNGYIFFLDSCKRAVVVDPAGIAAPILRVLKDKAYHLQYILVTHKHADHCDAVADVVQAFPDARIVMHALDAPALGPLASDILAIRDGDELAFGNETRIRAIHTPGHTDGSLCFLIKSTIFTGDTLFAGSVGGIFGELSTYDDILHNIEGKLFTLPEETVVMPGHGPPTTITQELAHNPFFVHHE